MINALIKIYRMVFARAIFYKLNKLIYRCSLSGLGILNYESGKVSGEDNFLKKHLKNRPEGVVIDVGANIGNYYKRVLEINKSLTVYAFEPHPATFEKLSKTIQFNNFHAINAAVGDSEGVISLYDYEGVNGSEHASMYRKVIENIHNAKASEYRVRVCSLSKFVKKYNIQKIALLKIDTEGSVLNVLRGVTELIESAQIEAIHFEFNEMNIYSRTFFRDFWDLMPNYEFYRLLPDDMVKIDRYSPLFCEIFAYQNFAAIFKSNNNKV